MTKYNEQYNQFIENVKNPKSPDIGIRHKIDVRMANRAKKGI